MPKRKALSDNGEHYVALGSAVRERLRARQQGRTRNQATAGAYPAARAAGGRLEGEMLEHLSNFEIAERLRTLPANWYLARAFYEAEQERREPKPEPEPEPRSQSRVPHDVWKLILAFRGRQCMGARRRNGCMNHGCHKAIPWHWDDPWCELCDPGNLWDD